MTEGVQQGVNWDVAAIVAALGFGLTVITVIVGWLRTAFEDRRRRIKELQADKSQLESHVKSLADQVDKFVDAARSAPVDIATAARSKEVQALLHGRLREAIEEFDAIGATIYVRVASRMGPAGLVSVASASKSESATSFEGLVFATPDTHVVRCMSCPGPLHGGSTEQSTRIGAESRPGDVLHLGVRLLNPERAEGDSGAPFGVLQIIRKAGDEPEAARFTEADELKLKRLARDLTDYALYFLGGRRLGDLGINVNQRSHLGVVAYCDLSSSSLLLRNDLKAEAGLEFISEFVTACAESFYQVSPHAVADNFVGDGVLIYLPFSIEDEDMSSFGRMTANAIEASLMSIARFNAAKARFAERADVPPVDQLHCRIAISCGVIHRIRIDNAMLRQISINGYAVGNAHRLSALAARDRCTVMMDEATRTSFAGLLDDEGVQITRTSPRAFDFESESLFRPPADQEHRERAGTAPIWSRSASGPEIGGRTWSLSEFMSPERIKSATGRRLNAAYELIEKDG